MIDYSAGLPPNNPFQAQREYMVTQQLQRRGITDQRVLDAMATVPRELFIPAEMRDAAYEDGALPIGDDQTISQPFTVAFMCQAAGLTGTEKVLEVGAGSGYGAAVLSRLARVVYSIERLPQLAERAAETLRQVGYDNAHIRVGDGTQGLPEEAPFDAIIVTAGAEGLPKSYWEQITSGGRIIIPIGHVPHSQTMYRFNRRGDHLEIEPLGSFAFVPLIGQTHWHNVDVP